MPLVAAVGTGLAALGGGSALAGATIVGAGAGIAGSVISSNAQKKAADKATAAQTAASDQQIALQREQNAKAEASMAPYVARGEGARQMLDARWAGPPDPRAAAYGPQSPGGPYGPLASTSAYGQAPSVFGAGGAPRASTQVGYQSVPQVGVPTRSAPAAAQAPRWQSVQASGLPPLPQWNAQAANPATPAPPIGPTNHAAPNPLAGVNPALVARQLTQRRGGGGNARLRDGGRTVLV